MGQSFLVKQAAGIPYGQDLAAMDTACLLRTGFKLILSRLSDTCLQRPCMD